MQQIFEWSDIPYFLAAARGGNLSAAARQLKVNRSTVFRRIEQLETSLGVKLFERLPDGLALSEAGQEMLETGRKIEEQMLDLGRRVTGRDYQLSGVIRVTTTDDLAYGLLPRHLARFHQVYPSIQVELVATARIMSLTKRDADVALRATRDPEGEMVGRKLSGVAVSLYGTADYLEGKKTPVTLADLKDHSVITFDESFAHLEASKLIKRHVPETNVVYRTESLVLQLAAVRADVGLAYLPCYLGDRDSRLVRIFPPDLGIGTDLWLVTHGDLRRNARVRAFMESMAKFITRDRDFLEGRCRREPMA